MFLILYMHWQPTVNFRTDAIHQASSNSVPAFISEHLIHLNVERRELIYIHNDIDILTFLKSKLGIDLKFSTAFGNLIKPFTVCYILVKYNLRPRSDYMKSC